MSADDESQHPLQDVDLHCTIVSRAPFAGLMRSLLARASAAGWSISSLEMRDEEDEPIVGDLAGHARTRGSFDYATPTQVRRVFWSSSPRGTCCEYSGGVYIRQFAAIDEDLATACERAIAEMMTLFGGPETLCVALGWEDDHAIDVGPGIVGVYRRTLGLQGGVEVPGARIEERDDEWVEVRAELSQQGREAAVMIQAVIAGGLARACDCEGPEA
ncbi:hypothetical protein [Nannocystis pusilla]|uniref:hypothetical protein n=1 Tax=Nannocystis pusilla TaxID=889268 RepID=UPI003DA373AD